MPLLKPRVRTPQTLQPWLWLWAEYQAVSGDASPVDSALLTSYAGYFSLQG